MMDLETRTKLGASSFTEVPPAAVPPSLLPEGMYVLRRRYGIVNVLEISMEPSC